MAISSGDLEQMAHAYTAAWNTGSPQAVAERYAEDGYIIINRGAPWKGRAGLAAMAGGFMADFPGMTLTCDFIRNAGDGHALFAWTLTGHHAQTGNLVETGGWEEWELDENLLVKSSLGWFDAEDYQRQVDGG